MNQVQKILLLFLLGASIGCDPSEPPTAVVRQHVETAQTSIDAFVADPALKTSDALEAFLVRFDKIAAKGFVPTLRRGSTGIGYTLESLLEIEENNSPAGDFMGMEIKAFRDDDLNMDDAKKMNLFLKEPVWIDGLKSADRILDYGYVDSNGRNALYSTVQSKVNSHQFHLEVDHEGRKLWLCFGGDKVAFWENRILEKRLTEKHSETVFVSAHARGKGRSEQFHYYGVTWFRAPSVDEFLRLVTTGDVMLELRMHIKETGGARNHGSCFRIKQNRLKDLFSVSTQVRP